MLVRRDKCVSLFLLVIASALWLWSPDGFARADDVVGTDKAGEEKQVEKKKEGGKEGKSHDKDDLTHANGSANLEKPEEFKYDLSIYTLVVFLLLLLILWKFAWGPITSGLDKREQGIAAHIEEAKQGAEKANQTLQQYQAQLAAAADEVKAMMAEARRDADSAKERILSEAQDAAQRERDRALADIETAKNKALSELAQKSVDTAVALAGRVVRKEINAEDHAQLIQESLQQFPSRN